MDAKNGTASGTGVETLFCGQVLDTTFVPSGPDADQQFQYKLRLGGADDDTNQAAATYQYIALCDPVGRFCRAYSSAFFAANTPRTEPIDDPSFTAEFAFMAQECYQSSGSSQDVAHKGPGHAADDCHRARERRQVNDDLRALVGGDLDVPLPGLIAGLLRFHPGGFEKQRELTLELRRWQRAFINNIAADVGFTAEWHDPFISKEGLETYGAGFFENYLANPQSKLLRLTRTV